MSDNIFRTYNFDSPRTNAFDVSPYVTNVSPKDSPLFSMLNSSVGIARVKENVTDSLTTPTTANQNSLIEGADFVNKAVTSRSIESNVMQIFGQTIEVSGTQEAVAKYGGVNSELAYQVKKAYTEIATSVEWSFINSDQVAGDSATARRLDGLIQKITTNTTTVTSDAASITGETAADLAAFEDVLNAMFQQMWTTGQPCDTVLVGGSRKRRISKLTNKVTRNIDAEQKTQILSINVYDSDFGTVNIILDRYVPDENILAIALDMWEVSYLRRFTQFKLAKTADSTQIAVVGELTLDAKTERAGGKITIV